MKRVSLALVTLSVSALLLGAVVAIVGCEAQQAYMAPASRDTYRETPAAVRGSLDSTPSTLHRAPADSWVSNKRLSSGYETGNAVSSSVNRIEMPPGSLPALYEEVWVIVRTSEYVVVTDEDSPRSGALMARLPSGGKEVPVPLQHTDVRASIAGYIATVDVTQTFQNSFSEKIEAVYLFPLPQNAAVNDFIMTVGDRRIRGIIRERKEAEQIYAEAKRQGYVASLLTQERPNIFTQKVANIEPGKEIDVNIRYFQTLEYADGWYEYEFPMVVGPRFNPPGSISGVGAVGRGSRGVSGQTTEVQYLRPGERSGQDISLSVRVDAGVAIEEISSPTHATFVRQDHHGTAEVTLSRRDAIPNKDFVLRYRVAGKTVKSALLTHRDERGGFFTLMVVPPADMSALDRRPMEMVFVLDCSGSMNGWPVERAKKATERALRKLGPNDTFQIIRFSNEASQFGSEPIPATRENVRRGLAYVESLRGEGGTMMINGIRAALDFPHDDRRLRVVSFMTDGYIGNETEILGEIHRRLGSSRIFSFGIGTSVNRYLIESMGKMGRGAVAFVGSDTAGEQAIDAFYNRICHPAMTDISIDWGDMRVTDVYPSRLPDLFVGRPVLVTGRFTGAPDAPIRITGEVGNRTREIVQPVRMYETDYARAGIASVWARMKIADIAERATWSSDQDLGYQIRDVALEYGLMSAYTAFVAVDSMTRTAGRYGTTVVVPEPVPEGVRYETTVDE